MPGNRLLVEFAGSAVGFSSSDPASLKLLAPHLRHCSTRAAPIAAEIDLRAVDSAGGPAYEAPLKGAMDEALEALSAASATHAIFRAASLALGERGLMLCGPARSGKSSLAAWLTASGMDYLGDELVAIPVDGTEMSGLCRSVEVEVESAFILERWVNDPHAQGLLGFSDGSAWIDPELLRAESARPSAPLALVLFSHYDPQVDFEAAGLKPEMTAFLLQQNLVNAPKFADRGVGLTQRLARQVTAFGLTYGDLEWASSWIRDQVRF